MMVRNAFISLLGLSLVLIQAAQVFGDGPPANADPSGAPPAATTVAAPASAPGEPAPAPGPAAPVLGAITAAPNGSVGAAALSKQGFTAMTSAPTCGLIPPDDFKAVMSQLLSQISALPPSCSQDLSKQSSLVDNYVTNYVNAQTPDGAYCYNYQTVLQQQYTYATTFTGAVSSPPSGPFASCFTESFTENADGSEAVSYQMNSACMQQVQNSDMANDATYCNSVRNTNFQSQSITTAISGMADQLSKEKPQCQDLVAPVLNLVGDFVGMTPAGLPGVALTQILTSPLEKLFRHKDKLQDLLKGQATKMEQETRACQYDALIKGLLECKPSAKAVGSTPPCFVNESDVTLKAISGLADQFQQITKKIDLSAPVNDDAIKKARPVLNDQWMTAVNKLLSQQVFDPSHPQDKISLYQYLKELNDKIPSSDFASAPIKAQLSVLLPLIDPSTMAAKLYGPDADADKYRHDIISAFMGITPHSSVANPLDIGSLSGEDSALKTIMNYEQSLAASSALSGVAMGGSGTTSEESANDDLIIFSSIPGALDDVNAFTKSQVARYIAVAAAANKTDANKRNTSGMDSQMVLNVKNEAIQACTDLAAAYFYQADKNVYENASPTFAQDYKNVCNPMVGQGPAGKPDVIAAILGAKDPASFKTAVCGGM